MIDIITSKSGKLTFVIGKTHIALSPHDASSLGDLLRHESVEKIADSSDVIRVGDWRVSGAQNEESERGRDLSYRRILLGHGDHDWHLSREEVVTIGSLLRTGSPDK